MKHEDSHRRCLVAHSDHGQCVKCTCGEYVRPDAWDVHCTPGDTDDFVDSLAFEGSLPIATRTRIPHEPS